MKNFTDQEINDAIKQAPSLVQEAIASGETTATTIAHIGQRYQLHIDQIGKLAELSRNALLGLIPPQEFLEELLSAKIQNKDAREIMGEINQKIFVPLRKKEEEGVSAPQAILPAHIAPLPPRAMSPTMPGASSPAPVPRPVAPAPETPLVKSYGSDPYREPIG